MRLRGRQGWRTGALPKGKGRARRICALAVLALVVTGVSGTPAPAQVFTETPAPKAKAKPRPKAKTKRPASPGAPGQPNRAAAPARPSTFADPAAYCAARPNSAAPDASYVGQPVPAWIPQAIAPAPAPVGAAAKSAGGKPQAGGAGAQAEQAYNWRCMDGRVLACSSAVGQGDCDKPSNDTAATYELRSYCTGKRKGKVPREVTGNVLPIWECKNGNPAVTGYRSGLDHQGYDAARWFDVTDFSPANMIGAMPRSYAGTWLVVVKPGFFDSLGEGILINGRPASMPIRGVGLTITGGRTGAPIGVIEYYTADARGEVQLLCRADMILVSATPYRLEFDERLHRSAAIDCGTPDRLALQPRDGKLFVEWRKPGSTKPRKTGWAEPVKD